MNKPSPLSPLPNRERRIVIKVPATSANLGPGFDALGLALGLWNVTTVTTDGGTDGKADKRISITIQGEGAGLLAPNGKNLIARAALKLADRAGKSLPSFSAECFNQIPLSSGLGSSAAAIVTGLMIGNTLLGNPFSEDDILDLASEMDGHPDNVAPALMGGLVVSIVNDGKVIARQIPIGMDLCITVALPDFYLPTKQARAALPRKTSMKNAVHNISRAVLVTEAFRSGDLRLLGEAMTDKLHQPYRLKLIPGAQPAMEAAKEAGAAAVALSGAGPSLIAFSSKSESNVPQGDVIGEAIRRVYETVGLPTRVYNLRVSGRGAGLQNL